VAGARVEIAEGPQVGQSTTTNDGGQFELSCTFVRSVTLRATKDGYAVATQSFNISPNATTQYVNLNLESLMPPVDIAGEYFLTLTADSACVDVPAEARTRRYEATISPSRTPNSFRGSVGGASFIGSVNWFAVGVAGDYVAFSVDFDGPTIVEELAPKTYLAIDGLGEGFVATPKVSVMSVPFEGYIDYCVLKPESPMNYSACVIQDQTAAHVQCMSKHHRLTLTRR
jgi:hypothetical protein